jgi:hypothetical protein
VRRALGLFVVFFGVAAPAWAHGGAIEEAVEGLATAPVYVEPGAKPTLTDAAAERLADRIRTSGRAIYVAVIDRQDDPAHDVVHELVGGLGRDGTYVVVAGGDFGVHATELDHEVSDRLQAEANAKPKDDLAGSLNALVNDVEREAAPVADDDESTPWVWVAVALVGIAAVAGAATFWALRRGRRPGSRDVAAEPPA